MIIRTKAPAAPMAPTRFQPILLRLFRSSGTIFPLQVCVDNCPPPINVDARKMHVSHSFGDISFAISRAVEIQYTWTPKPTFRDSSNRMIATSFLIANPEMRPCPTPCPGRISASPRGRHQGPEPHGVLGHFPP